MFDQAAYWLKRHAQYSGDLRSVGNLAHDAEAQEKGAQAVLAAARAVAAHLKPATVLDVGCGIGRTAPAFASCDYTGIDISPVAIDSARRAHPGGSFIVADLADWDTPRRFDLVLALYVFVHFVDDHAWRSIVTRCLAWVAAGGSLVFADRFPEIVERDRPHATHRPIAAYEDLLSQSGFRLDGSFPGDLADSGASRHFRRAVRIADAA